MSEMISPHQHPTPWHAVAILLGAALAMAAAAWAGYEVSLRAGVEATRSESERRLYLFERTLEANIERFRYLPSTVAQSRSIREVLRAPLDEQMTIEANSFLSNINSTAMADELFVMDTTGRVVAASNWWSQQSLVGNSYEVRPYFAEALESGSSKYYAVGLTTHVPGYFLAERIDSPEGPVGVAVAKINLGEVEAVWWRSGELIAITDDNGVIILSTRPDWRYRPLSSLSPQAMQRIEADLRYSDMNIQPEGITSALYSWGAALRARMEGSDPELHGDVLVLQLRMPLHGWTLYSFASLEPLIATARLAALAAGAATVGLFLGTALLIQRRRLIRARLLNQERLEAMVDLRTAALVEANRRLETEISVRELAEKERRNAEEQLVQAAKLASLGQALAGVAHEISQPLAALNTKIASAKTLLRNNDTERMGTLLGTMGDILARLSALTGHLKTFARRETDISIISDVVQIIHNALELGAHKLTALGVTVTLEAPRHPLYVLGNPIHLEQVFLNLISNAADAMEEMPGRVLTVKVGQSGGEVSLSFIDTGPGIPPKVMEMLFDPFFTTKEPGKGLGLGLSISYGLVRDMKGTISAETHEGLGSTFTVTLPLTEQRQVSERSAGSV